MRHIHANNLKMMVLVKHTNGFSFPVLYVIFSSSNLLWNKKHLANII